MAYMLCLVHVLPDVHSSHQVARYHHLPTMTNYNYLLQCSATDSHQPSNLVLLVCCTPAVSAEE
jgi:hypothetical protein